MSADTLLSALGISPPAADASLWPVTSPIDGREIGGVGIASPAAVEAAIVAAQVAFREWRLVPAPRRGALIRGFGEELRAAKEQLAALVTLESGKIRQEALGEVQEMIDICDFAVGLSRQLYGLTIASERPGHRLMELWHPLGPIAVITAFNFPVAVFAWNFALAIVCGDPVVWKPSEKTPLSALACRALFERACRQEQRGVPAGLLEVVVGGPDVGRMLARDARLPLVSATGSCAMGRSLAPLVAGRFGRTLLELGGNNAMIVTASADLALAEQTITFAAVGTAGQRCTSLRRLLVHDSVADALVERLKHRFQRLVIGDPREDATLIGPLIDKSAFEAMQAALVQARAEGGQVSGGERVLADRFPEGFYVRPALVEMPAQTAIVGEETFAPILYVLRYRELADAIALQNGVRQGLASSILTSELREAEAFLAADGSDCGIINVNVGPSGAEIGGAFGGEKETGGGREAGSDAWKAYMRRATCTVNVSPSPALAQGIVFADADSTLPPKAG